MTQPVGFCSECSGEVYADVPTKLTNLQGKKSGQNISYCAHCYQVKLHEKLRGDFEYAASDILSGLSDSAYKNIQELVGMGEGEGTRNSQSRSEVYQQ